MPLSSRNIPLAEITILHCRLGLTFKAAATGNNNPNHQKIAAAAIVTAKTIGAESHTGAVITGTHPMTAILPTRS